MKMILRAAKHPLATAKYVLEMIPLYAKKVYWGLRNSELGSVFDLDRRSVLPRQEFLEAEEKVYFDMEKSTVKYCSKTGNIEDRL